MCAQTQDFASASVFAVTVEEAMGRSGQTAGVVQRTGQGPVRDRVRVNRTLSLPFREISFKASRSSGPGGQHANKSETRIEATFDVMASETLTDAQKQRIVEKAGPVLKAVAQDERSQLRNKELAAERIAKLVAQALKTQRKRVPTKPSEGAVQRRIDEKRHRSEIKRHRQTPVSVD